jgi:CxxC-x17-CxxC domain-containing protein
MNAMNDAVLECKDCGRTFTFTKGEQEFYAMKGLSQPTRCPDCRRIRKQQKSQQSSGGGYYDSGPQRRKEVFDVVCDSCGRQTTVPFKPTGRSPVLCRDCFNKSRVE